jgi:hypothetical protein
MKTITQHLGLLVVLLLATVDGSYAQDEKKEKKENTKARNLDCGFLKEKARSGTQLQRLCSDMK